MSEGSRNSSPNAYDILRQYGIALMSPDYPSTLFSHCHCLLTLSFKCSLNHIRIWKGGRVSFWACSREIDVFHTCCLLRLLTPIVMTTSLMSSCLNCQSYQIFLLWSRKMYWVEDAPLLHPKLAYEIFPDSLHQLSLFGTVYTWEEERQ